MDFLSDISDFASNFISAVRDFGRELVETVGPVWEKYGDVVLDTVREFAKEIGNMPISGSPEIEVICRIALFVVDVISAVAEAMAEKPENETAEEVGYKAKVAYEDKGVKPENFDSTNEYIEYLRNNIKVDEEQLHELNDEERAVYAAVGAGLYVKQVEEKYGMELPAEFWHRTASLEQEGKITKEMPADLIQFMKEHGVEDGKVFSDFVDEKLDVGSEEQEKMYDVLKDVYQKETPDATDDELISRINSL